MKINKLSKISDLTDSSRIYGVYHCYFKDQKKTRYGDPFLNLSLSDSSGNINAKIWGNADYYNSKFDEGDIVLQNTFKIDKTDLYKDLRKKQAKSICELINKFLKIYPNFIKKKQIGEVSYYRKRNINDNKLNLNQSLKSNFRILRLSDNEKFPSWFFYKGKKFIIKIYKE